MKNVLYILSGNLSTTPRALQSIRTARYLFEVDILAINRNEHWNKIDQILAGDEKLNYNTVNLQRRPYFRWIISSAICKLATIIYPLFRKNLRISAYASAKAMFLLEMEVNKKKKKYDLILAHSYSSLYPAFCLSKKQQIPFVFDIEDYHPGEKCSTSEKSRRELLMKRILPKASCLTYASPLIGRQSLELLKGSQLPSSFLVNNCFPQNEFEYVPFHSGRIKFLWFSQNIAANRGLELLLPVLYKFKADIELCLIGNLYQEFYNDFLIRYKDILNMVEPMPQAELHKFICNFNIGLAIEQKSSDFNRDICLTNKIFAYSQAGLFILATDTSAQKQFINEHPSLGILAGQNTEEMESAVAFIVQNIQSIREEKKNRFEYAKKMSWEHESQKLMEIWEEILGDISPDGNLEQNFVC